MIMVGYMSLISFKVSGSISVRSAKSALKDRFQPPDPDTASVRFTEPHGCPFRGSAKEELDEVFILEWLHSHERMHQVI